MLVTGRYSGADRVRKSGDRASAGGMVCWWSDSYLDFLASGVHCGLHISLASSRGVTSTFAIPLVILVAYGGGAQAA